MNERPTANTMRLLILGVMMSVAAARVHAQTTPAPSPLQQLVNDTAAQIQLSYRTRSLERQRRHEQLAQVVEKWRKAERTEANDRLLADWLRAAILGSMPGSREALPALPHFDVEFPTALDLRVQEAAPTAPKWFGDPFADDPLTQ
jgi:hypothetical protein